MSDAERPDGPDRSWAIVGNGLDLITGPTRAFAGHPGIRVRVGIAEPYPPETLGRLVAEPAVAESGVRAFSVPWHDAPDGRIVALNPAGGNQVSWSSGHDDFRMTATRDTLLTSVHVRYVVRHLTTTLLEQDLGGRAVHAVTATHGSGVVAVAGPTRSGKTRLMNRLIADGIVGDVHDDDCPIVCTEATVATLVPRRYELARAASAGLVALILLTDDTPECGEVSAAAAREFLERTPTPWPARWLPAPARPSMPELPAYLRVLAVPAQDEDAHRDVTAFLSAAS